jgi:DNA-binding beta-propeller fold protein YncE
LLVCSSLIAWGALSTRATPRVAAQQPAGRAGVIYALTDNREQQRGEIVALEERTGAVLNRLPTRDEPDLLVTPDGNRLFILDTAWSADGKTPTHQLRLVEALSWRELARAEIADRISYAGGGPTGLALSPDKTRLFVYSYRVLEDSRADYWLTVVDARSLQTLPTNRIALPNCGGARLATLQRQVAVLCSHTNDLRFVDPAAATVTATLPLPALKPLSVEGKPSGLAMAVEGQTVYVITNDLRIIEIDASTHTLTREVASSRTTPQSVPLGAVEVSRDGQRLVVGVSSQPRSRATTFVLRSFALPSLAETETVTLPTAAGVAAAPDGGVYLFEGNELRLLGPERQQAAPLVRFDGRIQRLVR